MAFGQTLITSSFTGADSIQWSQFPIGIFSTSPPVAGNTSLGHKFLVNMANNGYASDLGRIIQQGTNNSSWDGDFATGDTLLWGFSYPPITIDFYSPVTEVGAYIEESFEYANDVNLGPFANTLTAYYGATDLGTVTEETYSEFNQPGTASFLGISGVGPITSVVFNGPPLYFGDADGLPDFAIDTVELANAPKPVPGPSAFLPPVVFAALRLTRRRRG